MKNNKEYPSEADLALSSRYVARVWLSETLIKRNIKDKIFVPFNLFQNKKEILKKKKNLVVITAIKKLNKRELNIEAIKQNCKYYYFNDEIYEVKND